MAFIPFASVGIQIGAELRGEAWNHPRVWDESGRVWEIRLLLKVWHSGYFFSMMNFLHLVSRAQPFLYFLCSSLAAASQFLSEVPTFLLTHNVGVVQDSPLVSSPFYSHSIGELIQSQGFKYHFHSGDSHVYIFNSASFLNSRLTYSLTYYYIFLNG